MYDQPFNLLALREISTATSKLCRESKLPRPLSIALGRCLRRRWSGTTSVREVAVHLLEAAAHRELRAVVWKHRMEEAGMWGPGLFYTQGPFQTGWAGGGRATWAARW